MKRLITILALSLIIAPAFSQKIPSIKITDLEKIMTEDTSTVLVVNFWATFCKPCVAEIPSFISTTNKYKSQGIKLMLVSLDLPSDYPAKVETFASEHNYNTNIAWLNENNADYFCPKVDRKWSGSIPSTLMINRKTGYRKFFEEEMKPEIFEAELQKALAGN